MSDTLQNGIPPVLVETISGLMAGLLSTLVAHPLDLIKVRLQGSSYPSLNILQRTRALRSGGFFLGYQ